MPTSFDIHDVDPNLLVVPENEGHALVTQGEIDEVVLELMTMEGDAAPTCQHAAALIALLARYIHQSTRPPAEQLH